MPLVLYGSALSGAVRAVLLTAKVLDIPIQLKEVNVLTGETKTNEYIKMNPAHTIPTLDDDGFVIWESKAINCYLVDAYGKNDALYPKDLKKRAAINNILFWDGTAFYPSVGAYYYPNAFHGKPLDADLKAAFLEKVSILEDILGRRTYLAGGENMSLADISFLCSLTTPEAAGFSFSSYPNISAWQERVKSKMPFYDDVTAEGLDNLAAFMQKNLPKK